MKIVRATLLLSTIAAICFSLLAAAPHGSRADDRGTPPVNDCKTKGCVYQDTFPCTWTDEYCEFQYNKVVYMCEEVPDGANINVQCSESTGNEFQMLVFPREECWKYDYYYDDYVCNNPDCRDMTTTSPKSFTGTADVSDDHAVYIEIENRQPCSRVTCSVSFT